MESEHLDWPFLPARHGEPSRRAVPGRAAQILLVGDDTFTRSELSDAWRGSPAEFHVLPGAERARGWLRGQRADCVLWQAGDDWRTVRDFLRALRRGHPHASLPVLVWQSSPRPAAAMAAYRAGASEVIAPPCDVRLLNARLALHSSLAQFHQAQQRTLERLRMEADTDPLTRIANRRAFFRRLEAELERAQRHPQLVSLIVGDIDHFKGINDRYGHPMGDRVLVEVARQLKAHARAYDWVGRLGGEEFALLLPHAEPQGARRAADRLRRTIARSFATHEGLPPVTLSIGVAMGPAGPHDDAHSLWSRADRALYEAKMRGRNQVVWDGEIPMAQTPADPAAPRSARELAG